MSTGVAETCVMSFIIKPYSSQKKSLYSHIPLRTYDTIIKSDDNLEVAPIFALFEASIQKISESVFPGYMSDR